MRAFSMKHTAASHQLWIVVASEVLPQVVAFFDQMTSSRLWQVVA